MLNLNDYRCRGTKRIPVHVDQIIAEARGFAPTKKIIMIVAVNVVSRDGVRTPTIYLPDVVILIYIYIFYYILLKTNYFSRSSYLILW